MDYQEFLSRKVTRHTNAGFEVDRSRLNSFLFPFQAQITATAIEKGRYAIFAECGLGKTLMQLAWAQYISEETNLPVLVLCPLAVSGQTIREGEKFGIEVVRWESGRHDPIQITNYEQLHKIDVSAFSGVVLDESSILKNFTGKMRQLITHKFKGTPYRLACTATPSPNDFNEIGNHSEFLGVLDAQDMRSRWFVRDEGMNNYRLKGHAERDFFGWISSWATMIKSPSDIGFDDAGYELPSLCIHEHEVKSPRQNNGKLFNDSSINATEFNRELRNTMPERMAEILPLVNDSEDQWIVWIKQNAEGEYLCGKIAGSVEVTGSESPESKERKFLAFQRGEFRVLITKPKIAQFGLNFQNCHNQAFPSIDFSFEAFHQQVRRSYRFGQKEAVNIHAVRLDTMSNVLATIKRKQKQYELMQEKMNKEINAVHHGLKLGYDRKVEKGDRWEMWRGDSVQESKLIDSNSIDFSVFSPPFSTLFTYSDQIEDMGNCVSDEEFFQQTEYLLTELYRIMKPGRLVAVHTKDLARYKNSAGFSGMFDFTGEYHRVMERAGFKYHSKVTIWTDPVLEMQRTKTQRLLYKQVTTDSSYTGIGMPEYVTIFRKWEGSPEEWEKIQFINKENFPLDTWQRWASPVWMDIQRTDVLNDWRGARDAPDEKHICPLQLGVIRRLVALWSNENDLVFSPFAGIGSEGYEAIKLNRRFLGIELKEKYFEKALQNLSSIEAAERQLSLF